LSVFENEIFDEIITLSFTIEKTKSLEFKRIESNSHSAFNLVFCINRKMRVEIDDEDDVATLFDLLNQGNADSTLAGRKSALGHFGNFKKAANLPDELSESQACDEKIYQGFALHLAEKATKSNGQLIMAGTATQYLSVVKEYYCKKY
jgi:hypothetical protein